MTNVNLGVRHSQRNLLAVVTPVQMTLIATIDLKILVHVAISVLVWTAGSASIIPACIFSVSKRVWRGGARFGVDHFHRHAGPVVLELVIRNGCREKHVLQSL